MSQPTSPHPEGTNPEMEDIDPEAAMAAAMGFSAFGTQPQNRPSKKRKFNPSSPDGPPLPAGTGANSLPVHPRSSESISTGSSSNYPAQIGTDLPTTTGAGAGAEAGSEAGIGIATGPEIRRGGGGGGNARGGHGHGHGQRNPLWYTDYYDPTSNQNPWERLEQMRGLPAVGPWLPPSSSHSAVPTTTPTTTGTTGPASEEGGAGIEAGISAS
ncbi:hypothetical protein QBC47DRAFT_369002 [Echria macrotheca]|uniref:Uncharacterized protein n=1 Tax=Echria macrotheca TaxID=438768 RepID=A0AAJ0FF73_9PEZI|nr:hypothetical protein QBC47DRAFT_369002 [Echria macrotheca]